jgi:hypothetical protein
VPYDFAENEYELDPLATSARGGGPPRKSTGIGIVDPPFPIPEVPSSPFFRILAGLVLAAIAVTLFFVLFARQ